MASKAVVARRRPAVPNDRPQNINELPLEILTCIISLFPPKELGRTAEVCHAWRDLMQDASTWRSWHRTNFGGNAQPQKPQASCDHPRKPKSRLAITWKDQVINDVLEYNALKYPEAKLQWAASRDYHKLILRSLEHFPPSFVFWNACYQGAVRCIETLIAKFYKLDLNAKNGDGWPALCAACHGGHENVVKYLLDHGCLVDIHDSYGWTPLCWAVYGGQRRVVQQLLRYHALVNHVTDTTETPLSLAEEKGFRDIAKELQTHGALPLDNLMTDEWTMA